MCCHCFLGDWGWVKELMQNVLEKPSGCDSGQRLNRNCGPNGLSHLYSAVLKKLTTFQKGFFFFFFACSISKTTLSTDSLNTQEKKGRQDQAC